MNELNTYDEFLSDLDGFNPNDIPASFQQRQYLATLFDSGMVDAVPEKELIQTWDFASMSFSEANELISRIIECQPDEVPIKEKDLAKWIKKNKL